MKTARLRAIPSVDKTLQSLGETGLPAPVVVAAVRRHLSGLPTQKKPIPPEYWDNQWIQYSCGRARSPVARRRGMEDDQRLTPRDGLD